MFDCYLFQNQKKASNPDKASSPESGFVPVVYKLGWDTQHTLSVLHMKVEPFQLKPL